MALLFSLVHVSTDQYTTDFIAGGIPRDQDDLQEWDAFNDFAEELDREQEVEVHAEAFLYGEGESEYAGPDDVDRLSAALQQNRYFLQQECDNIEEVDFFFVWTPEELYEMEMG